MGGYRWLVTAVAVALSAGLAGPASAADPSKVPLGPAQTQPIRPQSERGLIGQKPDLLCTLSALNSTAAGQPPIANGATVNISEVSDVPGGVIDVWFPFTIKNIGKGSVDKSFEWTLQIKRNNVGKPSPHTVTPPVAPGEAKVNQTAMVQVPIGTTTMEVTINADSTNQITEVSKANNVCKVTITTVRKGPQAQVTFAGSLYPIYSHQRCVNCHGAVNQPAGTNHGGGANPNCVSCHTQPPGWKHDGAPSFVGKNAAALCELAKSSGHVNSSLTQWAFTGSIDDATKVSLPAKLPHDVVPGGHAAFVQKWKAWETAGKPCP
jgi:hypothetical protein